LQIRHADLTWPANHEEIEEVITQGNNMKQSWPRLLCAGALALTSLISLSAHAQYSWLDDKGARVFSDRPPPPDTPAERILKMPRGLDPRPAQLEAAPATAPASPAAAGAADKARPLTLAERDADFRKRAAQREADEKKAAQEASTKAASAENCAIAHESARAVNSGMRISRVDAKGETVFLTDEERAERLEHAQKVLKSCR
jgi:hypothetical protein